MLVGALLCCCHPARVDNDLPRTGRSRFDLLIGNSPVPYPFARLIARIESQLQPQAAGLSPVKITFIPLGRSLQRSAAAPDFFKYPRVVAAVDGSARAGFAPLRDRLFLGYQEKTGILEVISYNEAAARFEFQVVRDYRAGAIAKVRYARRALCLACHQNAAPIFSRPLWDESPANPAIARRLRASRRSFYGLQLTGTDVAYFIAAAAQRANLFQVWQQLWREGCGAGGEGARCRRDWFDAALRYALSGSLPSVAPVGNFEHLRSRWAQLWPSGLAIPNPDIPNRNPLAAVVGDSNPSNDQPLALAQLARIPARFEPLNARPPLEIWTAPEPRDLTAGLASMLGGADVEALDEALAASSASVPVRQLALPCRIRSKPGARVRFSCAAGEQRINGEWTAEATGGATGRVDGVQLATANGAADIILHGRVRLTKARLQADFSAARNGMHARLSDGRLLQGIHFTATNSEAEATLRLRDDYAVLRPVLDRQAAAAASVFDSEVWMAALLHELRPAPSLRPRTRLPAPEIEPSASHPFFGSAAQFDRQCGQCHNTAERFPPNFLHGDAAALNHQLDQCAERIYYRLSMWRVPEGRRGKTPMPPLAALATRGLSAGDWTRSPQLAALIDDMRARLRAQGEQPDSVLARPFEQLRVCLPATVNH